MGRGRCSASKEKFFRRLLAQPHDERILGCFPHEWQSSGGTLQASCSAAVGLWAKVYGICEDSSRQSILHHAGANEIPGVPGKQHPLLPVPRAPYEKDDVRADACGTPSAAGIAVDRCRGAKMETKKETIAKESREGCSFSCSVHNSPLTTSASRSFTVFQTLRSIHNE
ncbi:uncharacterized protein LOC102672163 isoform X1 [Apis dorsata]|uniref:uncharacterized protein LOC102672163 isoform X1 n=1 Tax=Apis dorsata TaxID=7462 RepID=UPI0003DF5A91|nr:uncharacterized protein LOC102672163 isoform X1 [Apis dorsata]XP_006619423.1 uncharacterized protein LOC102672163 isoform X1 [Apis dorsata]